MGDGKALRILVIAAVNVPKIQKAATHKAMLEIRLHAPTCGLLEAPVAIVGRDGRWFSRHESRPAPCEHNPYTIHLNPSLFLSSPLICLFLINPSPDPWGSDPRSHPP